MATPVELRAQPPAPNMSILRAEHNGIRYQVAVAVDPHPVTGNDRLSGYFETLLDNFASSVALRRDGATERLRVGGHPAAQARFSDGALRAVVRAVHRGDRTVILGVLTSESVEENNPAVGGFLNSLVMGGPK